MSWSWPVHVHFANDAHPGSDSESINPNGRDSLRRPLGFPPVEDYTVPYHVIANKPIYRYYPDYPFVDPTEEDPPSPHRLSPSRLQQATANAAEQLPRHGRCEGCPLCLVISLVRRFVKKSRLDEGSINLPETNEKFAGKTQVEADEPPATVLRRPIRYEEWRGYGAWARPKVNGVRVENHGPPNMLDTPPMSVLWSRLRDQNGEHPERWAYRYEHPCLPPRPAAWKGVIPGQPLPFPWEVHLNPALQHIPMRTPTLWWELRGSLNPLWVDGPGGSSFRIAHEDWAQPATQPFLTHMTIVGIADCGIGMHLFNHTIHNPYGIIIEDIVKNVQANMQQNVDIDELAMFKKRRRGNIKRATQRRVREVGPHSASNSMKRVDLLGERYMFYGLEPSPDKDGWIMFVGPDWRSDGSNNLDDPYL